MKRRPEGEGVKGSRESVTGAGRREKAALGTRGSVRSALSYAKRENAGQMKLPFSADDIMLSFDTSSLKTERQKIEYIELQRTLVKSILGSEKSYEEGKEKDEDPVSTSLLKIAQSLTPESRNWVDLGGALNQIVRLLGELKIPEREEAMEMMPGLYRSASQKSRFGETSLLKLKRKLAEIYNLMHKEKIYFENGVFRTEKGPLFKSSKSRTLTPARKRMIKQVGSLVRGGKNVDAKKMYEQIRSGFHDYAKIWKKGDHNFMTPKEEPDEVVKEILRAIWCDDELKELFFTDNSILELGPGIGNDAVSLVSRLPNISSYHAIEKYLSAARRTRERVGGLKRDRRLRELKVSVTNADFLKRIQAETASDTRKPIPKGNRRIVLSKSTLHYDLKEVFAGVILPNLNKLVDNGYLVLAMKTPESATWDEHEPIYEPWEEAEQDGYLCGIHKKEGQLRAFVTKEKLEQMLSEAGFEIIKSKKVTIPDYDSTGQDEIFSLVIAKVKDRK